MPIMIDMEGVNSDGFEPYEAGDWPAIISSIKLSDKPGQSGYRYITFEFTMEDSNRKQWRNYSLSPNALWALKEDLVKLGVEVPDGEFEFDESELLGEKVTLTLSVKPHYKGGVNDDGSPKMDNEVDSVSPREGFDI